MSSTQSVAAPRVARPYGWAAVGWSLAAVAWGVVVLFVVGLLVQLVGLVPFSGRGVLTPFVVDSAGSAAATVAWAAFAVAVATPCVAQVLEHRLRGAVSDGWVAVSLAAVVGVVFLCRATDGGWGVLLGALVFAPLVRTLVLLPDGAPRPFPLRPVKRVLALLGLLGLALASPWALTHPLSGGTVEAARVLAPSGALAGTGGRVTVQLHVEGHLRPRVSGVRAVIAGDGLRVTRTTLDGVAVSPAHATVLGRGAVVGVRLTLRPVVCFSTSPARLTALEVRYRVAGVAASQRVPLDRAVTGLCR